MAAASPSLVDIDKVEEDIRYCEEYLAHDSALHAAHLPTEYDTQRDSLVPTPSPRRRASRWAAGR